MGRFAAAQAAPVDVEARLRESTARLVVKCEGIKRRFRLAQARSSLGRGSGADVLLPNDSVSELHAEITFDGTTWTVRDRGSTNGTFADGTQLRGNSQPIGRHSLLGLGVVRAIFLCNDAQRQAADLALEERALRFLVGNGRLPPEAGREAVRIARADPSQSIAEVLLMDTALTPAEWASAIVSARSKPGLLDRLRALFARLRPPRRPASPPR
ncbi:MAG: FHA domain-containing protein [Planctomycetes bacterium]|nr:FHA domain-containing protein [Planctomycetota bacterium]